MNELKCVALCLIGMFACAAVLHAADKPAGQQEPNIVIILTDDLGYGDVSFLNPKSKIKTPQMDALASAGVRATDAHAPSSVCSPTRYALLTGRYAWRGTLKRGVLFPWDAPAIERDRLTLPGLLKSRGYDTACIGKWHLGFDWPWKGGKKPPPSQIGKVVSKAKSAMFDWSKPITGGPLAAGFDYYFGDDVPNFPPFAFIENERTTCDPVDINAKQLKSLGTRGLIHGSGPGQDGWAFEKVMPAITDKAVNYIRQREKNPKPYFLLFSTTSPHTPVVPVRKFQGVSKAGSYGDFVVQTDDAVGQVVAALKKTGQYDNTFLIVTSDNGPCIHQRGLIRSHKHSPAGSLRGMKFDLWEGGHRVPFIASWPKGGIHGGRRTDALISLTDLFATCASILKAPLGDQVAEDSLDILPSLIKGEQVRTEMVYHSGGGKLGLRSGHWVYMTTGGKREPKWYQEEWGIGPDSGRNLLFDLSADLAQIKNVHGAHADRLASMKKRLETIRKAGSSR